MAEISGQPIVNRSDSVAASYLKTQDYLFNPISSGAAISLQNIAINSANQSGVSNLNIGGGFLSGNARSITAANSGPFAPLGFISIFVSGTQAVVPFFAP